MLKIVNDIKLFPEYGVQIRILDYNKYFHWLCFYFYWHHKSIFEIKKDKDYSIQKKFNKFR